MHVCAREQIELSYFKRSTSPTNTGGIHLPTINIYEKVSIWMSGNPFAGISRM